MTEMTFNNANELTKKQQELSNTIEDIIQRACTKGATAAEVSASVDQGYDVSVRKGEVETLEYTQDKGIGITVYFGDRKGGASTTDTSPEAIESVIDKACNIARYTGEDSFSGLAEADLMAFDYPDLDLCHPWHLDPEQAIELAQQAEQAGFATDKRISNSDGTSVSTYVGLRVYANSHGFIGSYPRSRHGITSVFIANAGDDMQRDYDYTAARDPRDLTDAVLMAKSAAQRTVARLNAQRLQTQQVPVIFSAQMASSLISHFLAAIRGSSIYRQASCMLDQLQRPVFAPHVRIHECPHLLKGLGSAPFDNEGVGTKAENIVADGILQRYLLSSYSARKLQMQTTGNAGGARNVFIDTSEDDLPSLMRQMGTGLYVTELMGQGVNIVTGDYSRGAAGFWVENGKIQYPVHEVTIAGNLRDMFQQIVKVGNDVDRRSNIQTGSILIENMMLAGE